MTPKLVLAEYVDHYRIRVGFDDGLVATIDLANELWGEVFEPLRDVEAFRAFRLDAELNTLSWSTGADFAPEFLHRVARLADAG